MKYLSVCSGIEAASVAWHHLGWEPVGFSEIEPFPAAVLAHRFPNVPNYGDMTEYEQWPLQPGSIDLLVGGTPCQSYSVAGLRQGLADPRGSLMLTYLAIAARLKPRWLVWENVPGVLSSNKGRDFGTFLGSLGELGYGWAYRVLDAQYLRVGKWPRAVPQRRRRVFVVGRLIERGAGDWTAAAQTVLIPEGLRRHNQAGQKARKVAPSDAEGGVGGGCWWDGGDCAGTLTKQNAGGGQRMPDKGNPGDPCHTLARDNVAHAAIAIQGNLVGRETGGPQGVGASTEGAMYTLTKADTHAVAFNFQGGSQQDQILTEDAVCEDGTGRGSPFMPQAMTVRRLSARECERLQGFPDDWTLIPWRGKPAEQCPDGPRYKALGNSMACNCMAWIGERIAEFEAAQ
jgi:DNA (cytosine-5)-methyltransferase 1